MNNPLIQKFILYQQPFQFNVVVPVAIAQERLQVAFQTEIDLGGQYFNTRRRYQGQLDQNQLKLRGPEGYRKFCFILEALVKENGGYGDQTQIDGHMTLCPEHQRHLMLMLLFLIPCCVVMFRWLALFYIPFFCAFLYWGVQLHFERYSSEMMELLANIMTHSLNKAIY